MFMEAWHLFQAGGAVMYPLLLCSIFVKMIAIERIWYYRSVKTDVVALIEKLKPALCKGDINSVVGICKKSNGRIPTILTQTLCTNCDVCKVESILATEAGLLVAELRKGLNWLDTIVTLSPLLGLLGTVIGMMQSFRVMGTDGAQPMAITGGVGEALIATATGLCVAVLALILRSILAYIVDCFITDMEKVFSQVANNLGWKKNYDTEKLEAGRTA